MNLAAEPSDEVEDLIEDIFTDRGSVNEDFKEQSKDKLVGGSLTKFTDNNMSHQDESTRLKESMKLAKLLQGIILLIVQGGGNYNLSR